MKTNSEQSCDIGLWQLVGFAVVSLAGTLLHFLYDWTGSSFAALFSGVNESTWEHMKLLFFPTVAFAVVESFFVRKCYRCFWWIKLAGTLLGLVLIPTVFYTLRGIFGTTPDWINIAIFFISAAAAFLWEAKSFQNSREKDLLCWLEKYAWIPLCLIAIAFWVFTFLPPQIPLFQDPIDLSFGLQPL